MFNRKRYRHNSAQEEEIGTSRIEAFPDRQSGPLPQALSAPSEIVAGPAILHAEPEIPALKRQVLLTGAAGGIGSAFFQHAASTYTFRLADRVPLDLTDKANQGHETMPLDIADLAACQQACQGIDTVVHLAADPSPEADFATSLLSNNILGTYNILRAAKDQGCRRVILASSVQVVLGYALDIQTNSSTPARPMNMYGVSKCFVEDVATYFAYAEKLSCIAIRIGAYDVGNDHAKWLRDCSHPLDRTVYVSPRDLNQLLERCIDVADVPFAIVDGLSNNLFKRADLTATRELLGYQPEDDAFEIFK
jgi:nucleoside-diphosphate-sugar epimerase